MKVVYEWLKEYVGDEMPTTEKLEELLTFHAFEVDGIERVGDHEVIDVKVLPDRSSDCLSHRGIAREISTLIGSPLVYEPLAGDAVLEPKTNKLYVTIHDDKNCRRFTGALITGVEVKESPTWLRERLEALGQRSINNVVDATNYVMLALGQPLHAYDGDLFPHDELGWHFGVRMAHDGETVTTLSNETYTLTDVVQLIVEGKSDTPVGIAGIKGGKSAEIKTTTKTVIIEAANFDPVVTRRATQFLKLQTDASKRFENDLPPALAPYGTQACVALILEIAGGVCEGYVDVYPNHIENKTVTITRAHIESLLGITLGDTVIEDIFVRLGFAFSKIGETWEVRAPFDRTDILIAEDVIAEVGRVHGYAHVESVVPVTVPLAEINARHYYSEKIRESLIAQGFSEVITSSFRKKDQIELLNALASDKGCLRSALRENIYEVLDRNIPNKDLLGVEAILVFEIGTVFEKTADEKDVTEHVSLCIGARTKQQGATPKDDAHIQEVVANVEAVLGCPLGGALKQGVYECNLTALFTQLPVPTQYEAYTQVADIVFTPYSTFPFIARDIALWVPETTASFDIEAILKEKSGPLLTRVALFDEFRKEGRVSYAFRLIFQSFERTLTDDEVNTIMEGLYTELKGRGFEIR